MLGGSKSIISDRLPLQDNAPSDAVGGAGRIAALDGLRGLLASMVIVSHYFGEVAHAVPGLAFGWVAVVMFFVLSGFLIGRIIIAKQHHANFFLVFYVRRLCRIMPAYLATLLVVRLAIDLIDAAWLDEATLFPLWAYILFAQGLFMAAADSTGVHWLAPTWSLALEEHFYLLAPMLIVLTPRRHLVPALLAVAGVALAFRVAVFGFGVSHEMTGLLLLPARADVLVCGLLAAIACNTPGIAWARLLPALRVAPIVALILIGLLQIAHDTLFDIFAPLVAALGCTAYLLSLVHGAPEAARFQSRPLRFIGRNGLCLYLTHQAVLGLMHGLILNAEPDLATPSQWAVTLAALPLCGLVGWGMTTFIEQPVSRLGRGLRWSEAARATAPAQDARPLDMLVIAGAKP
jgi:peptidoglycan/LPS O-acetylase OafA/YrhL